MKAASRIWWMMDSTCFVTLFVFLSFVFMVRKWGKKLQQQLSQRGRFLLSGIRKMRWFFWNFDFPSLGTKREIKYESLKKREKKKVHLIHPYATRDSWTVAEHIHPSATVSAQYRTRGGKRENLYTITCEYICKRFLLRLSPFQHFLIVSKPPRRR